MESQQLDLIMMESCGNKLKQQCLCYEKCKTALHKNAHNDELSESKNKHV